MGSKLKASGFFFGAIFLLAALLNLLNGVLAHQQPLLSMLIDFRSVLSLLIVSALMFASGYINGLVWLQPILFLGIVPLPLLESTVSFFGLGFFAVAVLLLFKLGFYNRHRIAKSVASVAYILVIEVVSALQKGENAYAGFMPAIFILAFLFFLFLTFRDRIIVYLKEPKATVSLEAKGLADAEKSYVRAVVKGKTVKEVCFDYGVSESTVRNTLSRAYKKLGISSKSELATLAEKFDIVP